jgi:hypothetical protein
LGGGGRLAQFVDRIVTEAPKLDASHIFGRDRSEVFFGFAGGLSEFRRLLLGGVDVVPARERIRTTIIAVEESLGFFHFLLQTAVVLDPGPKEPAAPDQHDQPDQPARCQKNVSLDPEHVRVSWAGPVW